MPLHRSFYRIIMWYYGHLLRHDTDKTSSVELGTTRLLQRINIATLGRR